MPTIHFDHNALRTGLCWTQGIYYLVTGLWPIISVRSFQRVTGPKTDHLPTGRESDHWLLMAVAVLIVAISATLLLAAWRKSRAAEITMLAILAAVGLSVIDVIYVLREVIAPIYLLDAALEAPLIAAWLLVAVADMRQRRWLPEVGQWGKIHRGAVQRLATVSTYLTAILDEGQLARGPALNRIDPQMTTVGPPSKI